MDFKRYFGKNKDKIKEEKPNQETDVIEEVKSEVVEEVDTTIRKTLDFVDTNKDPHDYLKRYLKESTYKDWFNRNYPNHTIYDAVGLSISDYLAIKRELFPESSMIENEEENPDVNFQPTTTHETKTTFDEFIDERILVSRNAFGNKEMKIKILDVYDETAPFESKFGDRF